MRPVSRKGKRCAGVYPAANRLLVSFVFWLTARIVALHSYYWCSYHRLTRAPDTLTLWRHHYPLLASSFIRPNRHHYSFATAVAYTAMSQIYLVSKEEAKEQVLDWIRRSFVHQEGQSIPRKEAHERYLAWCAEQKIEPTTQAVFGKLLCEVFGEIKSRRLGSRNSSMMYYSDFYYSQEALACTPVAAPSTTLPPAQPTPLAQVPMVVHHNSTPYAPTHYGPYVSSTAQLPHNHPSRATVPRNL